MTKEQKAKILLVDDDRLILSTLATGLRACEYEVFEAASGKEALRLAEQEKPDLALLDIRLPDLSGPEIARILDEEWGIPALFLSAHDDKETVEKAVSAGGLGYLVKPFSLNHLIPALEVGLRQARQIRAARERDRQLQAALERNRDINVAVGVLMERHKVARQEAYESLRLLARSQRCKVLSIATQVVESSEFLNEVVGAHLTVQQKKC